MLVRDPIGLQNLLHWPSEHEQLRDLRSLLLSGHSDDQVTIQQLDDFFKPLLVCVVEGGEFLAVDIQNSIYLIAMEHGDYDFAL